MHAASCLLNMNLNLTKNDTCVIYIGTISDIYGYILT